MDMYKENSSKGFNAKLGRKKRSPTKKTQEKSKKPVKSPTSFKTKSHQNIMKELAELKVLMKAVAEKYPPKTKVVLPVHTIVLPRCLDQVDAKKQTMHFGTECKQQFEVTNQKPASPANQKQ